MAGGLNGLKALFSASQVKRFVDSKAQEFEEKVLQALQFKGEQFVNNARDVRTYQDQTGNLRSSIGYLILKDGRVIHQNFAKANKGSGGSEGVNKGKNFANELAARYPKGFILIGVAGMDYAAYVEAKGYDVITGSSPSKREFKDLFSEIKF